MIAMNIYELYKLVLCLAVLIPEPKQTYFIYYWLLEQVKFAILVEMLLLWRQGDVKYFIVVPLIIIFIILMTTITTDYSHKHRKVVSASIRLESIMKMIKWRTLVLDFDMLSYFITGVFPALYLNIPHMVYSLLALGSTMCLVKAILADILIWHITIGYRMDVDAAFQIYYKVLYPTPIDILDIRYCLCDELRKQHNGTLKNIKALIHIFPDYMSILDRDGLTSPFQLACEFSYVDVVKYMVEELDDKVVDYVDDKGNTPLHSACRNQTRGLKMINYLLQKRMSLVTVPNEDGDLPIHVASDSLNLNALSLYYYCEPVCTEIVWRLLLAYPDCMSCLSYSESASYSKRKDIDKKKDIVHNI